MNSTCSFPLIIRRRLATLRRIRPASCVWGVTWGCPLPLTTHRRPVCFNEFPARSPLSYFRIGVNAFQKSAHDGNTLAEANLALRYLNRGFFAEAQTLLEEASRRDDVNPQVGVAMNALAEKREADSKGER